MAKLHKKIIGLLQPQLRDFQDALDDLPGGRVAGVVISSSFKSLDHQKRQEKLMSILESGLTAAEFSAVGAIAALTPAEVDVKAI